MLNLIKSVSEEMVDPITMLGLFSLGVWNFADDLARFLNYFESHQVALTGFVLFLTALIKKFYELKAARNSYLESKRPNEEK